MSKVLYKQGTKATYLNLPERLSTALYFCTDTCELFKGDDLYTDGIRKVANFTALPEFNSAADGKLYFCEDSGCGYILNSERNGWELVVFGVDNNTIEIGADGLIRVKAVPISSVSGLSDKLTEIEQKIISGDGNIPIATNDTAGLVKGSAEVAIAEDGSMSIIEVEQTKIAGLDERLNNIEASQVGGIRYKGNVPTIASLPDNAVQGDLYEVTADNSEWCFNGEAWFEYGTTNNGELKPIAKADINDTQLEISEGVLNIKNVDASLVMCREQKLDAILDSLAASIAWETM